MTLVQHLMEGGSPGATLTNATSGSSTGNTAGGTQVFATATAAHGGLGASFTNAAGSGTYRRWNFSGGVTATTYAFSGVLTLPASAWTQTVTVAGFPVSAGANANRTIQVNAAGQVGFGGSTNAIGTALTFGTKYRFSIVVNGSTSQQLKVYQQSSPGVWDQQVGTTATTAHADYASGVVGLDAGINQAPASSIVVTVGWDDLQLDDGRTTEIPDYTVANVPPVVTAGPAQTVAAGATVTLAFTATDGDGSIDIRATTFDFRPSSSNPTISSGTGNAPTFTAGPAGSRYVVRHTATDNLGATGYATTEIFVPLAGGDVMSPEQANGTGVGTWANVGAAANQGIALSDNDDATYVESPAVTETEQTLRVRLRPSAVKADGQLKNRLWTDTGTANATVRLYEGATLRQSWTHPLTSTPTEFVDNVSGSVIAAITDWKNLYIEVGVVQS